MSAGIPCKRCARRPTGTDLARDNAKRSPLDEWVIQCYKIPMNNNERFANQLCNVTLMFSLVALDRRLLAAFDEDDHATIADCHDLFNDLVTDVMNYIPAAAA